MTETTASPRTDDQSSLFEAMARPDFYPHPVMDIQTEETHISRVFLTGDVVYKVKKAVDFGFLDFSDLDKRRYYCDREVSLNRRLAPDVYQGVVPITRSGDGFALDGDGEVAEYAVRMRQLPADRSMARCLRDGTLPDGAVESLAEVLTRFYAEAETGPEINATGGWETVRGNCEENFTQLDPTAGRLIDERHYRIIREATRSFLRRRRPLFEDRVAAGRIRDCHGDLRSGHIYFTQDGVAIIDCIEFNDRFRYSDVAADLAFLAMDLDYLGHHRVGTELMTAYARRAEDLDLFILLDFYKSYRAVVRCKVACLRIEEPGVGRTEEARLRREADRFLNLAYEYAIAFTRPTIIVVCGMPASGKSTMARRLSDSLRVPVLRSDQIRKSLFQVSDETAPETAPFESGIYTPTATSLTYGRMLGDAHDIVKSGRSVILDATFGRQHHRDEARRLGRDTDANLLFVECYAPWRVLRERLEGRESTESVSDARAHHLDDFRKAFEPLDEIEDERHLRVNTEAPVDASVREILANDPFLAVDGSAEAHE
jgi:uncharacterized protein